MSIGWLQTSTNGKRMRRHIVSALTLWIESCEWRRRPPVDSIHFWVNEDHGFVIILLHCGWLCVHFHLMWRRAFRFGYPRMFELNLNNIYKCLLPHIRPCYKNPLIRSTFALHENSPQNFVLAILMEPKWILRGTRNSQLIYILTANDENRLFKFNDFIAENVQTRPLSNDGPNKVKTNHKLDLFPLNFATRKRFMVHGICEYGNSCVNCLILFCFLLHYCKRSDLVSSIEVKVSEIVHNVLQCSFYGYLQL